MKVEFVPEARDEFLNAISHYEDAHSGLGERFKYEIEKSIFWIADHAELYPVRPRRYRRFNLRTFPYYLPFIVRKDTLWGFLPSHTAPECPNTGSRGNRWKTEPRFLSVWRQLSGLKARPFRLRPIRCSSFQDSDFRFQVSGFSFSPPPWALSRALG